MSKWDLDRALDAVSNEIEALERVRREVVSKRSEGTKRMTFVLLGAVVTGLLVMLGSGSPVGLLVGVMVGVIGGLIVCQIYFGKGAARYRAIFKVGFLAKLIKAVEPEMTYVPERHFGWFGEKLQKLGGNLQKMVNPEFEKMFLVRGADAVEARYLLTPSMQERLVDLRKRLGEGLGVVFRDSHVWLAILKDSLFSIR
ncbi:MAG: hypothetical protein ACJAVK_001995 [Akkermansiaceae bacterium]|jgi:hypothetical protein